MVYEVFFFFFLSFQMTDVQPSPPSYYSRTAYNTVCYNAVSHIDGLVQERRNSSVLH